MWSMRETIDKWMQEGRAIGIATVISTIGTSPRGVGSKLATTTTGGLTGSVSAGGCVDGAVVEETLRAVKKGRPRRISFGVSDDTAWNVGLSCGGEIQLLVEPFSAWEPIYAPLVDCMPARRAACVVSVIDGPDEMLNHKLLVVDGGEVVGSLDAGEHSEAVLKKAREMLSAEKGEIFEAAEGLRLFIDVYRPQPRLVVVGGGHISEYMVEFGRALGFYTVLVDPREGFANRERFPNVDELINAWPDRALESLALSRDDYVAVMTHDPKLDDPALKVALPGPAKYVGALGSRKTAEKRRKRLLDAGMPEEVLDRLHAPIGIKFGGSQPPEIALSVIAQVVKVLHE